MIPCDDEVMRIVQVHGTPLFTGTAAQPQQIVRVTIAAPDAPPPGPVLVRVEGPGISTRQPFRIENLPPGAEQVAEVLVTVAAPHGPGSTLTVTAIAESGGGREARDAAITVAEPGWTIWMVSHFHYDPVWWNTQGEFTQTQLAVPGEDGELPDVRSAFELVRLHLNAARDDPDYKFVLAEVDYLKPYFDVHPEDRAELRELIAAGRVEIVGGAYNEPNTNLTSAESTIRNIVYGLGQQRDVLGADPSIAWALDAFGHDPGYPGLMAAAGMTGSAWARGPYHQWGPWRTVGDNTRMQFPSEFEWLSPDGRGLLTSYMANHYGAGWVIHQAADAAAAQAEALAQFTTPRPGGRDQERAVAGRRRSRDPGPVGDRRAPGIRRPLRVAAVRHRAAARVLRGGARRGRRARDLADPADQGHEPGLPGQGRLLHRHQAGPARRRGSRQRRRAAGHAGLVARRRLSRGVAGQGVAATGVRRTPRRDYRHRVRPGLPRPARRVAGSVRAGRCRAPGGRRVPRQPDKNHAAERSRRGRPGSAEPARCRVQHLVLAQDGHGDVHAGLSEPGTPWLALSDETGTPCRSWPRGSGGTPTTAWPA